jgi:glycosyltransferase involved in cell wall biosynthesis
MLEKFKYHLKQRGLKKTFKRFNACVKENGIQYSIQQMFSPIENKIDPQVSQGNGTVSKGINKDEFYLENTKSQLLYYEHYSNFPANVSRLNDFYSLLKSTKKHKGIILYPLSYDHTIKQRPEHILQCLANEGYLCLMMKQENNYDATFVEKLSANLYVTNLFEEALTVLKNEKVFLYITYPFYKYLTSFFKNSIVIYDQLDDVTIFSMYCNEMLSDDLFLKKNARINIFSSHMMLSDYNANDKKNLLIENGVWVKDFKLPSKVGYQLPPDVPNLKNENKKIVGYHGAISDLLNYKLLEDILSIKNVELYLIGPIEAFFPENKDELLANIEKLKQYSNFHLLGFVEYKKLKYYIHQFDFAIIPFINSDSTSKVSPLKLFEYLTCKVPVLSTHTDTLAKYKDVINIIEPADFVSIISSKKLYLHNLQSYQSIIDQNNWESLTANLIGEISKINNQTALQQPKSKLVDLINVTFYDFDGELVFKGGAERYIYDLAVLLKELGFQPRIFQHGNKDFRRTFKNIEVIGVASGVFTLKSLSSYYNEHCKDAEFIIASPLDLAGEITLNKKVIGINHGIYWDSSINKIKNYDVANYTNLFNSLKNVIKCVCVDTNFINWARTYDYSLSEKLTFIPNYYSKDQFVARSKNFEEKLIIIYPRRLYEARGLYITIEAFRRLLSKYKNMELHFIGQAVGNDIENTNNFIDEYPDQIKWYEYDMEDMHKAYEISHVVLVPTKYAEGTSLSCIEAMATNNAVVSTNIGGLPNLIINNYSGKLINPTSDDLYEAIEELYNDRKKCVSLAENAMAVAKTLEKSEWIKQWMKIIDEVKDFTIRV